MSLYHYTDRITGAEIVRDGVIRARSLTLHRDMLARDEGVKTEPIVWLTTVTRWDETVAKKMAAAGWPYPPVGHLWRIEVRSDLPGVHEFHEYMEEAERQGIDMGWWEWVVKTGAMAGSDFHTWRIVPRDIPRGEWVRVQSLTDRGYWMPI